MAWEQKKVRDIESKYSKGKQILSRLSHQYCYSIYQTCVQLLDFRYFARETAAVTSCRQDAYCEYSCYSSVVELNKGCLSALIFCHGM